ncbi:Hypothetical predicted protein [Podarcis lilfordi]|uniref:Uncharacterized protein n=1 Tax=Podarcis lilfordi TaxID=74358 RepID=A0AA35KCT7_9SAUR|nr:Hypothetical predicted protein [Podarcis lilfordi]
MSLSLGMLELGVAAQFALKNEIQNDRGSFPSGKMSENFREKPKRLCESSCRRQTGPGNNKAFVPEEEDTPGKQTDEPPHESELFSRVRKCPYVVC